VCARELGTNGLKMQTMHCRYQKIWRSLVSEPQCICSCIDLFYSNSSHCDCAEQTIYQAYIPEDHQESGWLLYNIVIYNIDKNNMAK